VGLGASGSEAGDIGEGVGADLRYGSWCRAGSGELAEAAEMARTVLDLPLMTIFAPHFLHKAFMADPESFSSGIA